MGADHSVGDSIAAPKSSLIEIHRETQPGITATAAEKQASSSDRD